jgi:demethylmenaquinone methyltransferase/2-methoxy-6-polyprenyl-1,4-benzoquinol methylase
MSFETNEAFYDRIANSYDAIAHSSEWASTEKGITSLGLKGGESVLEIGYGTGHALVSLAKAVGDSGTVQGVDISEGMQGVASRNVEKASLSEQVKLGVGSVPPLEFPDESFDVVFLSFTLELFPEGVIEEVVAECRRVLKDGGKLGVVAMAVPRNFREDNPMEKAYVWFHRHFPHIVDCHPIDVEGLLTKGGFTLDVAEHTDIWALPVAMIVGVKGE